ncbi:MAG TPA: carbohydrate ABC transporter permease [Candidatus Enteromonas pullicola]|uniref:Carbohydrate ABC transporter permease n=1 Tax=Candidatus Alloenteromonas pullicola TaxID=2840784 RepID=A0A9D1S2S3_9FIRM|nr:carbohydrate ABC transporter permease [Candidatus Enteromonas pullicola]
MRRDTWLGRNAGKLIAFLILLLVSVLMLLPIIWGVFGSFRDYNDFNLHASSFLPSNWDAFTFDGYAELFSKTEFIPSQANEYYPIWNWLFNSLIVAIGGTLLYLLIASLAAYAFVFLDFKYSNRIFYFLIGTMTIPGIISTAPQLINMNMLGFYKSLMGLIAPSLGGVYGVFLIRQFFLSIPHDLIENARLDGASNLAIFRRIVLPLGKSALFVQGLFGFMAAWNDVQWAQLIIGSAPRTTWTLAYGLKVISDNSESYEAITLSLASAVIAMIPIFIVYLLAQSKIIEGVAQTGIKH